jgi:AcrR family transcriptional regulator
MGVARTGFSDAPAIMHTSAPEVMRRRRGAVLEDAILDAVFDELADVGYAAFTIESVAARAQTGKASIYRRWPTKQDLVLDAFCARFGRPDEIVDALRNQDISTRDLLVALGQRICEVSGQAAEVVRAVACEVTRDAELAAAVEDRVYCPKRTAIVELLKRGVARGEVRPDAASEFYADVLPAVVMHRMILMNRRATEADVAEIIDRIVMPLIAPVAASP